MVSIFKEFDKELIELRKHLNYIQTIGNDMPNTSPLYEYIHSTEKRKFNYKAMVISLYGIIENFSEKFLIKYLELISTGIPQYESIKPKIKDNHLRNSATLTLKVLENKHQKYRELDPNTIIRNLYTCINNDNSYVINKSSFILTSGNLKHSKICDLYKQVDINIEQMFDRLTDFNIISSENKFDKIDEIVDRRNEIAHGALNSILAPSEFPEYIDFVEKYFIALYKVLQYDYSQVIYNYIIKYDAKEIEGISFFNGNIIGFMNTKRFRFRRGQNLLIVKDDGEINSVEINNFIVHIRTKSVTIKLISATNLKPNQKIYYITNYKHFSLNT